MADAAKPIIVLATCPADHSDRIASRLVEEGLAACVNILPGAISVYRWQGELHKDPETLLLIKTMTGVWDRLAARLKELHTYEVPEIICVPIISGYEPYLNWLNDSLQPTV